jgi:hypothetical protein
LTRFARSWAGVRELVLMQKGGHMSKLVIGLAAFVLLAASGALAGGALTDSTSDVGTTTDITTGTTTNEVTTADTTTEAEDVRGPCDEAEHANDPRCTGTAPVEREDRRGGDRGRDDDREHHEDRNDDRSGPNRGPG